MVDELGFKEQAFMALSLEQLNSKFSKLFLELIDKIVEKKDESKSEEETKRLQDFLVLAKNIFLNLILINTQSGLVVGDKEFDKKIKAFEEEISQIVNDKDTSGINIALSILQDIKVDMEKYLKEKKDNLTILN